MISSQRPADHPPVPKVKRSPSVVIFLMVGVIAILSLLIRLRNQPPTAYDRAIEAIDEGNVDEAFEYFAIALEEDPTNAEVYHLRGALHHLLGDDQAALVDLHEAIRLEPNNAIYYNDRGIIYRRFNWYEQAAADFMRAVELDPTYVTALHNRAEVSIAQNDFDAAITYYNQAVEIAPNDPDGYLARATAYYYMQDYDVAEQDLLRVIELDEQEFKAYVGLGLIEQARGNYQAALQNYRRALARFDGTREEHETLQQFEAEVEALLAGNPTPTSTAP